MLKVVTVDRRRIGTLVDSQDEFFIVELGRVFRSRRALPKRYAKVIPDENMIVMQVSSETLRKSPRVKDRSKLNMRQLRRFYAPDE